MNPGLVVKLRPAGPWRIGPGSGARNRVDVVYHSDSLYSAVTSAMARLGSLDAWLDATARNPQPAVCFSSCFPFVDELPLVVPPRTIWPPVSPAALAAHVRWKSARFVPLAVVQAILAGQPLKGSEWSVDGPSECLLPSGAAGPFRTGIRWSAAVDRLSGATERHSTACLEFRPGCGLWTAVSFRDEAAHAAWLNPVKAAFRLLADTGFGGERSRGWGRSEAPEFAEGSLPGMILAPVAKAQETARAEAVQKAPQVALLLKVEPETAVPEAAPVKEPASEAAVPEAAPAAPAEEPAPEAAVSETAPIPEPAPEAAVSETAPIPEPAPEAAVSEAAPSAPADEPAPEAVVSEAVPEAAPQAPAEEAAPETLLLEAAPEALMLDAAPETLLLEAAPEAPVDEPATEAPPAPLCAEPPTESAAVEDESTVIAEAAMASESPAPVPLPPAPEPPPPPAPAATVQAHWLLSLFTPAPGDAVDWARGNYTLTARSGRIESPAGSGELKKQVQMVTEGSVLVAPSAPCGAAPDVAPDGFAHPVFRAGFALSIPLPEVS